MSKKNKKRQNIPPRPVASPGIPSASLPNTGAAKTPQNLDPAAEITVLRAVEAIEKSDQILRSAVGEEEIQEARPTNETAAEPDSYLAAAAALTTADGSSVRGLIQRLQDMETKLNAARKRVEEERELYKKIASREMELLERERKLRSRELNAETGFLEQNRVALSAIDDQISNARKELAQLEEKIRTERASIQTTLIHEKQVADTALAKRRNEVDAELDLKRHSAEESALKRENEIAERERDLVELRRTLRREQNELVAQQAVFSEDAAAFEVKIQRLSDARINSVAADLVARTTERDSAREERNRLQEVLRIRLEADSRFGEASVEDVLERLRSLEVDNADLQRQLRSRPGEAVVDRNRVLEAERELVESTMSELRMANSQLESQVSKNRVAVAELEAIRDERKALSKANDLMRSALEELQTKVDQYVEKADSKTAFPACSKMDLDEHLQEAPGALKVEFNDFPRFVAGIRNRMAQDPKGPRYYTERDVRSFIAGLATSRLHLLQGISGTGKTSLPLAFARAIGAGSEVIEVQAGWRDRQDLLGHYNAFERVYYETEFLKSLYKAQLPAYEDRLFFVVLDEMNLSRPEQYFADLLSALERARGEQRLSLLPAMAPNAPEKLLDGRSITIPENIWFIGTANHDETTSEFADKTYDRSHIMELPTKPERFVAKTLIERAPISASGLQRKFGELQAQHKAEAEIVTNFIGSTLTVPMRERFGIAWANRLERQIEHFVPIVVAAGGSISEAADDLISMKILRKVRNRHDTQLGDIKNLRDELALRWPKSMGASSLPDRSLAILDREVIRLGGSHITV